MKKTLLLIALVCSLGALYFYLEQPEARFFSEPVFSKSKRITIIQDRNKIKIEKDKESWKITQPVSALAGEDFISNLAENLDLLAPDAVIEQADSRQGIYGLIPPELVLIIEGSFGREVLSFGKYADFALARYLQRENDPKIYLVKEDLFKLLNLDLNLMRSNRPIAFSQEALQSIAIIPANSPAYVIKKSSSTWSLESSQGSFDVDSKVFVSAIDKLSGLQAVDFTEQADLDFFGLTNPLLTLRILLNQKNGSKVLDLIFGKGLGKNPFFYMKEVGNPTIFQIYRGAISDWLKEIDFFRSRIPFVNIKDARLSKQQQDQFAAIKALGVMELSAFIPAKEPIVLNLHDINIEIGDKVQGQNDADSPFFIKINNEYVLILSAQDTEFLKNLATNVK